MSLTRYDEIFVLYWIISKAIILFLFIIIILLVEEFYGINLL